MHDHDIHEKSLFHELRSKLRDRNAVVWVDDEIWECLNNGLSVLNFYLNFYRNVKGNEKSEIDFSEAAKNPENRGFLLAVSVRGACLALDYNWDHPMLNPPHPKEFYQTLQLKAEEKISSLWSQ